MVVVLLNERKFVKMFENMPHKVWEKCWTIGIVDGGIRSILENDVFSVKWLKIPHDRWFADPFVLDVIGDEIQLLVEDYEYKKNKAVISILKINKQTNKIISRKVILELDTHLSFPNIHRQNGKVYVYPENCSGGGLVLYEYDAEQENLKPYKLICDDKVWDSVITFVFGKPMLFTANKDDNHLDIYTLKDDMFVFSQTIESEFGNSRMGGQIFEYEGNIYYPAQDCTNGYGRAIVIKELFFEKDLVQVGKIIKKIESPCRKMNLGLHTLNEYKNIAVVDACGYRYRRIVSCVLTMSKVKSFMRKICRI
ncbi:MAG: hypothetical protein J6Y55_05405 [Bacteroidales bacterium]|nr:hypothetical protein [Bacteroidales bacterium]